MTRVVASSVRGPAHLSDGLLCQDAWLAVTHERSSFAVVCDGMGSRSRSREGARAATLAARDAWRLWKRSPLGSAEDFVRVLEPAWRLRLLDVPRDEAATTCIVYAEDDHGRAVYAQLGDGLLARRTAKGQVENHPPKAHDFGFTHALGTPHSLADWSLASTVPLAAGEVLVLATDGVSNDLDTERIGDLARWAVDRLGSVPRPGVELARELRNWPVHQHQDDKTLLVMWKP